MFILCYLQNINSSKLNVFRFYNDQINLKVTFPQQEKLKVFFKKKRLDILYMTLISVNFAAEYKYFRSEYYRYEISDLIVDS